MPLHDLKSILAAVLRIASFSRRTRRNRGKRLHGRGVAFSWVRVWHPRSYGPVGPRSFGIAREYS